LTEPGTAPDAVDVGLPNPSELAALSRRARGIRERLREQMLGECEVMAQHALRTGLMMTPQLMARLDECLAGRFGVIETQYTGDGTASGTDSTTVVPLRPANSASVSIAQELADIHDSLARVVAPATPATLVLFASERRDHPGLSALGPVAVSRSFLMLGLVSLVVMLGVALSPEVNSETMKHTLLELSGVQLLLVELFLLSAASLGSCFSNLQKLNGYVSAGTYDPKFESTYWTRWVMGVISGILLSQILYALTLNNVDSGQAKISTSTSNFGEPMLALFGGYSAQLVHRIIARLLQAVETLFGADPKPLDTRPLQK